MIASLVYVARRVGQSTAMMRINAASERLQREYDFASPMIQSRKIAEMWVTAASEFDSLDDVDQERMLVSERRAIALYDGPVLLMQDLTTINVTNEQIVVRQSNVDPLVWPAPPPPPPEGVDLTPGEPSKAQRPDWLTATGISEDK